MLCKWCGMESATTDQCSWCHRPLSTAAPEEDQTGTGEAVAQGQAPVSLRKGPLLASAPEPSESAAESSAKGRAGAVIAPRAPWAPAAPAPPPAQSGTVGAESGPRPMASPLKSGKGGPRMPAPGMPPIRPSTGVPKGAPAVPHRHVPAPAILPISQQNRAGGNMPKSPYAPQGPVMAGGARPGGGSLAPEPAMSGSASHAASIADGMPVAEPGGLADGVAAPRSPGAAAEMNVPAMGAVAVEQSKYYPNQAVDPASGTHYDTASGRPTDAPPVKKAPEVEIEWESPATSMTTLVVRYLFAFAGVLIITALLAHAYKDHYVVTLLVSLFISGMLLPVMNVAPKQRDDSDDVWLYVGLTMIFGPAIGLIIYGVFGLIKQSANPAIVGCFIVTILTQLAVYLSASPTQLLFGPPWVQQGFELRTLFVNWCGFAAMVGWASANIFHRFDE